MVEFNIPDELISVQKFLNILGVQYFVFRTVRLANNVHKKPNKIRLATMLAKLIYIYVCYVMNIKDILGTTLIGSSLMATIELSFMIFWFILLTACIVKPYMATRKVKEIYTNTFEILHILHSNFSINFDFISFKKRFFTRFIIVTFIFLCFFSLNGFEKILQFYLYFTLYPNCMKLFFSIYYVFFVDLLNQTVNLLMLALEKEIRNGKIEDQSFEKKIFKLNVCRRIFNKIIDCGQLLNGCFGSVILIIVIFENIMMTITGYKILISAVDEGERNYLHGEKKNHYLSIIAT